MTLDLFDAISQANVSEIEALLKAVLNRYAVLFPDWEIDTVSVEKCTDRNEQLDRIIAALQGMLSQKTQLSHVQIAHPQKWRDNTYMFQTVMFGDNWLCHDV